MVSGDLIRKQALQAAAKLYLGLTDEQRGDLRFYFNYPREAFLIGDDPSEWGDSTQKSHREGLIEWHSVGMQQYNGFSAKTWKITLTPLGKEIGAMIVSKGSRSA